MITEEQLKKIRCVPITELLERQGIRPIDRRAAGIWYRAPWRDEKEPSLKVNPDLNVWFDFGAHVGGDNITLVQFHHNKPFSQACELIQNLMDGMVFDSTPIQMQTHTREKQDHVSYAYVREQDIQSPPLLQYLEGRRISKAVAERYCCELHYGRTTNDHFFSLAFKTGKGSYELRNANFKGCIGPKCIAIIHTREGHTDERTLKACVVFEGFFNMLTYEQLLLQGSEVCITDYPCDMIVLNSAGLVPQAQPIFDEYERIHCYLDNDLTGQTKTLEILDRNPGRASDESRRYESYNDLNDYLCGRLQFPQEDHTTSDRLGCQAHP